jgi:esterase/lipase
MVSTLKRTAYVLAVLFSIAASVCSAADKAGVVLLHGKDGTPSNVGTLADAMRKNGFIVVTPDMPFSRNRQFDKSWEDCVPEIDNAVALLRKQGAETIFIAGHSLGASMAIYYGTKTDVAGVLAIAPGGNSGQMGGLVKAEVERARALAAEGKGDKIALFDDYNQGIRHTRRTTAKIYLSYQDPDGAAVIPKNVAALRPGTPLLWVVGTKDPMYQRGPSFAFEKAPPNDRNKYVVVEAGHLETLYDTEAVKQIVEWLKGIPAR